MKDTLGIGDRHEASYVVTRDMCPPHLSVQVLSTPSMVALIEGSCLELAEPHLEANETTVGTRICVTHTGLAMEGETVSVSSQLAERKGRHLEFNVTVRSPREVISEGTHDRAVIDPSKFG